MRVRAVTLGLVLSALSCDEQPPGATATGNENDKDPSEVAAVDVPGRRDDRERADRDRLRDHDAMPMIDPHASTHEEVEHLVAVVHGLGDREVEGVVRLSKSGPSGVEVSTTVEGLPAGTHGYHVHMYGDCSSDDGTSAGPHLNFHGPTHHDGEPGARAGIETTARPGVATAPAASGVQAQPGAVDRTPATMIHGNLGDIVAVEGQPATATAVVQDATWSVSLLGRAVVIHAKGNDPTAGPDGGAGDPIACGVIGIARGEEGDAAAASDDARVPNGTTPGEGTAPAGGNPPPQPY
jgi:Cu-Zn family superoxide dismutase